VYGKLVTRLKALHQTTQNSLTALSLRDHDSQPGMLEQKAFNIFILLTKPSFWQHRTLFAWVAKELCLNNMSLLSVNLESKMWPKMWKDVVELNCICWCKFGVTVHFTVDLQGVNPLCFMFLFILEMLSKLPILMAEISKCQQLHLTAQQTRSRRPIEQAGEVFLPTFKFTNFVRH